MAEDFMDAVLDERRDDALIRLCAAGRARGLEQIKSELGEMGWVIEQHDLNAMIARLIDARKIARPIKGDDFFVPCCAHCGEPFLNVFGAEH